jgi:Holliday junction resolvase RusA-like endonuclease
MKYTIPGKLTDLNTYVNKERANRFMGANIKKDNTEVCTLYAKRLKPIDKQVQINFTWHCENQKMDPDNICFAKKYILDGLVKAGVLQNDGWKQIKGFTDCFEVDKNNPRIEVELIES